MADPILLYHPGGYIGSFAASGSSRVFGVGPNLPGSGFVQGRIPVAFQNGVAGTVTLMASVNGGAFASVPRGSLSSSGEIIVPTANPPMVTYNPGSGGNVQPVVTGYRLDCTVASRGPGGLGCIVYGLCFQSSAWFDGPKGFTPTQNQHVVAQASYSADASGSMALERSTDGGVTWGTMKSGAQDLSTMLISGTLDMIEPLGNAHYRWNCLITSGSIDFSTSDSGGGFNPYDPKFSSKGATYLKSGSSFTCSDQHGGFLIGIGGPVAGTTPPITSYTATVMRSTDGGTTWTAAQSGSSPFNYAVVPSGTPTLYRVDFTIAPTTITVGGLVIGATYQGVDDTNYHRVFFDFSCSYSEPFNVARWTPILDADLAGDLTLYKVCAGNTFAKLTVPAAARRIKGRQYARGGQRDIRGEYVDVVGVVDANGAPKQTASSQTDPQTAYTPGSRTTFRDPTGGTWLGDFMCTGFPLGLYGYPTLIEAVQGGPVDRSMTNGSYNLPQPNLAAIAAALG